MQSEQNKAIFLDRDGVINRERGDFTWLLEDFKINDGVEEAMQIFQRLGYMLIVISNQSGIGKSLYKKEDADYLHNHLERILAIRNVRIEEFYFCPHHPSTSLCLCRKPESLLIEKAIARFNINPGKSWFIGDADRDIEAGMKAGVKTIKIAPNSSLQEIVPLISAAKSS